MCNGVQGISPVFGLNVKCFLSNLLTESAYGQFTVRLHSTVPVCFLPLLFIYEYFSTHLDLLTSFSCLYSWSSLELD